VLKVLDVGTKRALDFALASIANFNELTQSAGMRLAVQSRRWKFVPPTPFGSLASRLLAPPINLLVMQVRQLLK
jgi:hypothetical protein